MRADVRRIGIASWAVFGVALLLAEPAARLAIAALPRLREGLEPGEWLAFVLLAVAFGYVEGYRGFSRSFCPRVVERAFAQGPASNAAHVALAPLRAMSLFGDEKKRVARSWALVIAIVLMVVAVRRLPHTWRCIVDASVALSLCWGLAVLVSTWGSRVRRELHASRAEPAHVPSMPPPPA